LKSTAPNQGYDVFEEAGELLRKRVFGVLLLCGITAQCPTSTFEALTEQMTLVKDYFTGE